MPNSDRSKHRSNSSPGAIFTPLVGAHFAIKKFGLFEKWIAGKTIFDPTMGEGHLLEGLISYGVKKGYSPDQLPLRNLYGVEMNPQFFRSFFKRIKQRYGIKIPAGNFRNNDIFFLHHEQAYDIIFGNPPWLNFTDLPESYKRKIKPLFSQYDLIGDSRKLLLGNSRIDIAALVIQKVVDQNLKDNGEAVFFAPLSLFLNEGAHTQFRRYRVHSIPFCVGTLYDFNDAKVFAGVSTRYGLFHLKRNKKQSFPISYYRWEENRWNKYFAKPLLHPTDPLSILPESKCDPLKKFKPIRIDKECVPRQGVNTCGANDIFFFDIYEKRGKSHCIVSNPAIGKVTLPRRYLFPLLTSRNFKVDNDKRAKWVLLPYNSNGTPLSPAQLAVEKGLASYLQSYKERLAKRKGTLINVLIKKGIWWGLLGVGPYNFFPIKLFGKHTGKKNSNRKFLPAIGRLINRCRHSFPSGRYRKQQCYYDNSRIL